jgi:hypothetical protein
MILVTPVLTGLVGAVLAGLVAGAITSMPLYRFLNASSGSSFAAR